MKNISIHVTHWSNFHLARMEVNQKILNVFIEVDKLHKSEVERTKHVARNENFLEFREATTKTENSRKSETMCRQHLGDKKQYFHLILFRCKSSVCLGLLRVTDIKEIIWKVKKFWINSTNVKENASQFHKWLKVSRNASSNSSEKLRLTNSMNQKHIDGRKFSMINIRRNQNDFHWH